MKETKYSFKIIHGEFDEFIALAKEDMFDILSEQMLKYQDLLELLKNRGYIAMTNISNYYICKVLGPLDDFKKWVIQQEKNEKRLNRREWIIAIICSIIGGIIGLIPFIISLL